MPTQVLPLVGFEKSGIIKDTPPVSLPPGIFTDGRNIRFRDGAVRKMEGEVLLNDLLPWQPTKFSISEVTYSTVTEQTTIKVRGGRLDSDDASDTENIDGLAVGDRLISKDTSEGSSITQAEDTDGFAVVSVTFNSGETPTTSSIVVAGDRRDQFPTGNFVFKNLLHSTTARLGELRYIKFWPNPNRAPLSGYYVYAVDHIVNDEVVGVKTFIQTEDADVHDITPNIRLDDTATYYRGFSEGTWQSTVFAGGFSFVLNNGAERPHYILDAVDNQEIKNIQMNELPGWDSYAVFQTVLSDTFDEVTDSRAFDTGQKIDYTINQLRVTVTDTSDVETLTIFDTDGTKANITVALDAATNTHVVTFDATSLPDGHKVEVVIKSRNPVQVRAGVVRSFGDLLVAGNLTENDTEHNVVVRRLAGVVRTSDVAEPGQIPNNWNPFRTGVNTADEFTLSDTNEIQDMISLQGNFYIYTNQSIHVMRRTGNTAVPFNFSEVTDQYGLLTTNGLVEYDGKHFVVGSNDIYLFAGHPGNIQSVGDARVRHYFYQNVNPLHERNMFVLLNQAQDEIWVCYPTVSSLGGECDEAIIWNYRDDTWTIRDLQDVTTGDVAPIRGGGLPTATIRLSGDSGNAGYTSTGVREVQDFDINGVANPGHTGSTAVYELTVDNVSSFTAPTIEEVDLTFAEGFDSGPNITYHVGTITFPTGNFFNAKSTRSGGGTFEVMFQNYVEDGADIGASPDVEAGDFIVHASQLTGISGVQDADSLGPALATRITADEAIDWNASYDAATRVLTLTSTVPGRRDLTGGTITAYTGTFDPVGLTGSIVDQDADSDGTQYTQDDVVFNTSLTQNIPLTPAEVNSKLSGGTLSLDAGDYIDISIPISGSGTTCCMCRDGSPLSCSTSYSFSFGSFSSNSNSLTVGASVTSGNGSDFTITGAQTYTTSINTGTGCANAGDGLRCWSGSSGGTLRIVGLASADTTISISPGISNVGSGSAGDTVESVDWKITNNRNSTNYPGQEDIFNVIVPGSSSVQATQILAGDTAMFTITGNTQTGTWSADINGLDVNDLAQQTGTTSITNIGNSGIDIAVSGGGSFQASGSGTTANAALAGFNQGGQGDGGIDVTTATGSGTTVSVGASGDGGEATLSIPSGVNGNIFTNSGANVFRNGSFLQFLSNGNLSVPGGFTYRVRNTSDSGGTSISYTPQVTTNTATNNTGFTVTINGTTVNNGGTKALQNGSNWSFTGSYSSIPFSASGNGSTNNVALAFIGGGIDIVATGTAASTQETALTLYQGLYGTQSQPDGPALLTYTQGSAISSLTQGSSLNGVNPDAYPQVVDTFGIIDAGTSGNVRLRYDIVNSGSGAVSTRVTRVYRITSAAPNAFPSGSPLYSQNNINVNGATITTGLISSPTGRFNVQFENRAGQNPSIRNPRSVVSIPESRQVRAYNNTGASVVINGTTVAAGGNVLIASGTHAWSITGTYVPTQAIATNNGTFDVVIGGTFDTDSDGNLVKPLASGDGTLVNPDSEYILAVSGVTWTLPASQYLTVSGGVDNTFGTNGITSATGANTITGNGLYGVSEANSPSATVRLTFSNSDPSVFSESYDIVWDERDTDVDYAASYARDYLNTNYTAFGDSVDPNTNVTQTGNAKYYVTTADNVLKIQLVGQSNPNITFDPADIDMYADSAFATFGDTDYAEAQFGADVSAHISAGPVSSGQSGDTESPVLRLTHNSGNFDIILFGNHTDPDTDVANSIQQAMGNNGAWSNAHTSSAGAVVTATRNEVDTDDNSSLPNITTSHGSFNNFTLARTQTRQAIDPAVVYDQVIISDPTGTDVFTLELSPANGFDLDTEAVDGITPITATAIATRIRNHYTSNAYTLSGTGANIIYTRNTTGVIPGKDSEGVWRYRVVYGNVGTEDVADHITDTEGDVTREGSPATWANPTRVQILIQSGLDEDGNPITLTFFDRHYGEGMGRSNRNGAWQPAPDDLPYPRVVEFSKDVGGTFVDTERTINNDSEYQGLWWDPELIVDTATRNTELEKANGHSVALAPILRDIYNRVRGDRRLNATLEPVESIDDETVDPESVTITPTQFSNLANFLTSVVVAEQAFPDSELALDTDYTAPTTEQIDNDGMFVTLTSGQVFEADSEQTTPTGNANGSTVDTTFDLFRPWPKDQLNPNRLYPIFGQSFVVLDDTISNFFSNMSGADVGYQFYDQEIVDNEGTENIGPVNYGSYVERTTMGLTPEFNTESLHSVAMWADGGAATRLGGDTVQATLEIRVAPSDSPGFEVDLGTAKFINDYVIGKDYKMDTRLNGRFVNYRISDVSENHTPWNVSGLQFEISVGGTR